MPLTERGVVFDPLASLSWDLVLASLALAKLSHGTPPNKKEEGAVAEVSRIVDALARSGGHEDLDWPSDVSLVALAPLSIGVKRSRRLPQPEAAVEGFNSVARYLRGELSDSPGHETLNAAQLLCQELLSCVNRARPPVPAW